MNKSMLTVIIPVFNTEEYINRCLESVTNQTLSDIRIIIVNDGSTDSSEKIIKKYLDKRQNIEYISLDRKYGVGNARNIGLENAKTKYIGFIDSDDWVDANYYNRMLQNAIFYDADVSASGIKTEVDDIYNWKYRYKYETDFLSDGQFCLHSLTRQYNHDICISPIVNNRIYKSEILKENKILFDKSRRAQDLSFSFLIFIYSKKIGFCHDVFYHYYQRESSATHDFSFAYIDDYFFILSELKKELQNRGLYANYEKEYEAYINYYSAKLIRNMFNNTQKTKQQKEYILYILNKVTALITLDKYFEFIDVERLKIFWEV